MAATKETSETWKAFYARGLKEPGDLFDMGTGPLSGFDTVIDDYYEDKEQLSTSSPSQGRSVLSGSSTPRIASEGGSSPYGTSYTSAT